MARGIAFKTFPFEQGETVHKQIGPHGLAKNKTNECCVQLEQGFCQKAASLIAIQDGSKRSLDRRASNVLVEASLCISMKELATADP